MRVVYCQHDDGHCTRSTPVPLVQGPFKDCLWALRQEAGEIGGRLHFHFLFAGIPPEAVQGATCMSIKAQWERIGGGMARVREFDPSQSGLEYILKCLCVSGGANLYEVGKSSHSADEMRLSKSFWNAGNLNRVSDDADLS
jgi:hypothetical protein